MQAEEAKNKAENAKAWAEAQKELAKAKKLNDEREFDNAIAQQKREKAEFLAEKKKMMEQLERDRRERFGGSAAAGGTEQKKPEKTPAQQVEHGIKTVKTLYTEIRAPGVAKTCLKTCNTFISNVIKDQNNEKFRRINLDNNAVKERVVKVNGGLAILKAVGFSPASDGTNFLQLETVDMAVLQDAVKQLTPHIG